MSAERPGHWEVTISVPRHFLRAATTALDLPGQCASALRPALVFNPRISPHRAHQAISAAENGGGGPSARSRVVAGEPGNPLRRTPRCNELGERHSGRAATSANDSRIEVICLESVILRAQLRHDQHFWRPPSQWLFAAFVWIMGATTFPPIPSLAATAAYRPDGADCGHRAPRHEFFSPPLPAAEPAPRRFRASRARR